MTLVLAPLRIVPFHRKPAVDLSIQAEMPSGPVALELSREDNREKVSSSVHNKSSGIHTLYGCEMKVETIQC